MKIDKLLFLLCTFMAIPFVLAGCGSNCKTNERYLVVTTFAGMANRLRILSSAKIMAALTERQLVVDWLLLKNEMPGEWRSFFQNPLTMFGESALARQGCSLSAIKSASSDDPDIKNLGSQNDSDAYKVVGIIPEYQQPIVYFATSLSFQPDEKYLSDSEYKEKRSLYYKNLDPTKWISDSVNKFKKDKKFEDFFMVGVHYRGWQTGAPDAHSALITDPNNKYIPEFITKMKDAVAKPLSDTDNKPVAFFLAADNENAKAAILAVPEFKGRVFARLEKADRSTIRGQESDLVDFFLLGSTNYIIGTYQSSFSDEAAHLTKQDTKESIGQAAYK